MNTTLHRPRAWLDLLCVVAFVACIGIVPVWTFASPQSEQVLDEHRNPARFPDEPTSYATLLEWPLRFENWFNDAWVGRRALLQRRQAFLVLQLGESPTPKLLLGRDGWLFPGNEDSIRQHRGLVPYTADELEEWRTVIEARQRACADVGAPYVFVLVPNKLCVYRNRLPSGITPVGPTRLTQLVAHLRQHTTVPVLDLTDALARERELDTGDDYSYFPLGTHWTDRGAYAGYVALLDTLRGTFPTLIPTARDRFEWQEDPTDIGDTWAGRLYLTGRLTQRVYKAIRRDAPSVRPIPWGTPIDAAFETDATSAPKLLMFHDSYGPFVRPFLTPHFYRAAYKWNDRFDSALVASERPDVVVQMSSQDRVLVSGYHPEMP